MHSEWRAKTKNTSNLNWLKESKTLRSSKNENTCLTYCLRQCWWWRKQKIRIISTYKREDNESNQKIYWAHNLREKQTKNQKKHTKSSEHNKYFHGVKRRNAPMPMPLSISILTQLHIFISIYVGICMLWLPISSPLMLSLNGCCWLNVNRSRCIDKYVLQRDFVLSLPYVCVCFFFFHE